MPGTQDVITVIGRRTTFTFEPISIYFSSENDGDDENEPDEGDEEEPCMLEEDDVANIVKQGIAQASDSGRYEYGAVLVEDDDGRKSIYQDIIRSDGQDDEVSLPYPGDGSEIGIVHNHTNLEPGNIDDRINRYPSDNDWNAAETLITNSNLVASNFTLYIIDTQGVMRAYPYTDRAAIQGLSESQKRSGVQLGRTVSSDAPSCG